MIRRYAVTMANPADSFSVVYDAERDTCKLGYSTPYGAEGQAPYEVWQAPTPWRAAELVAEFLESDPADVEDVVDAGPCEAS